LQEDQSTEYKESWRDECLKWICGFANADGGTLIVGCDDRGRPVGLKDSDVLLEMIPNKVVDILGIVVDVNLRKKAGKSFLEILVNSYPTPISLRGEYYYRSGSTNHALKGNALSRFLLRKQGVHWDSLPLDNILFEELDINAINGFRGLALSSHRLEKGTLKDTGLEILEKLHLVEGKKLTSSLSVIEF